MRHADSQRLSVGSLSTGAGRLLPGAVPPWFAGGLAALLVAFVASFPPALAQDRPVDAGDATATAVAEPDADAQAAFESQIQQTIEQVRPAVVAFGGGSGVVVSPDGLIFSVAHVANLPGRRLPVAFNDGRRTRATVIGTCDQLDIAVAKIDEPGPWPYAPLQEVKTPRVGEWLIVMGYPVSFRGSDTPAVRVGCVLRTSKNSFISDCPIMGGDSGGPVFDLTGNVVGISSRCQDRINYNVHVPAERFRKHWEALCSGRPQRLYRDDQVRPLRPEWDTGFGQTPSPHEIAFPRVGPEAAFAAAKPAFAPEIAEPQTGRRRGFPAGRMASSYRKSLSVAKRAAERLQVGIEHEGKRLAVGTYLFDPERGGGAEFVVTKASRLGRHQRDAQLQIRLTGRRAPVQATVVGIQSRQDLAVLRLDSAAPQTSTNPSRDDAEVHTQDAADHLQPRDVSVVNVDPVPGLPLLSLREDGDDVVGFLSATARDFGMRQSNWDHNRPMLGVSVEPDQEGLRITSIVEDSGADEAGLRAGDVLQQLNSKRLATPKTLVELIQRRDVGDSLDVVFLREGTKLERTVRLGKFQSPQPKKSRYDNWGGGPFSQRRFEIPHVITHDTPLAPEDCGGPLVDARGRLLGVNIARALRVSSYALPIEDVWQTVEQFAQL